jgi:phospholipid-binding lipoprotein MlaA
MMRMHFAPGRMAVAGIAMLVASGCSTLAQMGPTSQPALRSYDAIVTDAGPHPLEVADPLEGFNRGIYRFNYYFDEQVYRPVVRVYDFLLPDLVKDRIADALDNIGEFGNLTNNVLQAKLADAGITVGRVLINSTVGIAGLWDPATRWGLHRRPADFGQTLGRYGLGGGPYLTLPVLGPSNVRDATGLAADAAAFSFVGPAAWVNETPVSAAYGAVSALDGRRRATFRYGETGSPFEYEFLRTLYTIRRGAE